MSHPDGRGKGGGVFDGLGVRDFVSGNDKKATLHGSFTHGPGGSGGGGGGGRGGGGSKLMSQDSFEDDDFGYDDIIVHGGGVEGEHQLQSLFEKSRVALEQQTRKASERNEGNSTSGVGDGDATLNRADSCDSVIAAVTNIGAAHDSEVGPKHGLNAAAGIDWELPSFGATATPSSRVETIGRQREQRQVTGEDGSRFGANVISTPGRNAAGAGGADAGDAASFHAHVGAPANVVDDIDDIDDVAPIPFNPLHNGNRSGSGVMPTSQPVLSQSVVAGRAIKGTLKSSMSDKWMRVSTPLSQRMSAPSKKRSKPEVMPMLSGGMGGVRLSQTPRLEASSIPMAMSQASPNVDTDTDVRDFSDDDIDDDMNGRPGAVEQTPVVRHLTDHTHPLPIGVTASAAIGNAISPMAPTRLLMPPGGSGGGSGGGGVSSSQSGRPLMSPLLSRPHDPTESPSWIHRVNLEATVAVAPGQQQRSARKTSKAGSLGKLYRAMEQQRAQSAILQHRLANPHAPRGTHAPLKFRIRIIGPSMGGVCPCLCDIIAIGHPDSAVQILLSQGALTNHKLDMGSVVIAHHPWMEVHTVSGGPPTLCCTDSNIQPAGDDCILMEANVEDTGSAIPSLYAGLCGKEATTLCNGMTPMGDLRNSVHHGGGATPLGKVALYCTKFELRGRISHMVLTGLHLFRTQHCGRYGIQALCESCRTFMHPPVFVVEGATGTVSGVVVIPWHLVEIWTSVLRHVQCGAVISVSGLEVRRRSRRRLTFDNDTNQVFHATYNTKYSVSHATCGMPSTSSTSLTNHANGISGLPPLSSLVETARPPFRSSVVVVVIDGPLHHIPRPDVDNAAARGGSAAAAAAVNGDDHLAQCNRCAPFLLIVSHNSLANKSARLVWCSVQSSTLGIAMRAADIGSTSCLLLRNVVVDCSGKCCVLRLDDLSDIAIIVQGEERSVSRTSNGSSTTLGDEPIGSIRLQADELRRLRECHWDVRPMNDIDVISDALCTVRGAIATIACIHDVVHYPLDHILCPSNDIWLRMEMDTGFMVQTIMITCRQLMAALEQRVGGPTSNAKDKRTSDVHNFDINSTLGVEITFQVALIPNLNLHGVFTNVVHRVGDGNEPGAASRFAQQGLLHASRLSSGLALR